MWNTDQFIVESWIWYSIAIAVVLLRIFGQFKRFGIRGLKNDDYIAMIAAIFYSVFIIFNDYTWEVFSVGTDSTEGLNELAGSDQAHAYVLGSKYVLVAEQGMTNTLYSLKICMLLLYFRLTPGRRFQVVLKGVVCYVVLGWVGTQLAFFLLTCKPFSGNWATPPPDPQCVSWLHYSVVQGFFNISSDLILLGLPIPLFIKTSYPLKQKVYLCCLFSLGVFVIACAIINKTHHNSNDWQLWNLRETSTAMLVSNMPMLVAFLRSVFFFKEQTETRKSSRDRALNNPSNLSEGSGQDNNHCPKFPLESSVMEV